MIPRIYAHAALGTPLPFALRGMEARAQLAARMAYLPGELLTDAAEEATTAKRKIK